jgi:hypothetical protein
MKEGVSDVVKINVELVPSVASMKEEVTKVANVNAELVCAISKMKGASMHSMMRMQDQLLALYQTGIPTTNIELKHLKSSVSGMKQDIVVVLNTSIELKLLVSEMKGGCLRCSKNKC